MRFLKSFALGVSGLFAFGNAIALMMGDSLPDKPVNRAPVLPLLMVALGLGVAMTYEFVQGIIEFAEKRKARRRVQRR